MIKFDLKINGRKVSSSSDVQRELRKAVFTSAQKQVQNKLGHLPLRAKVVDRGSRSLIELSGTPEAIEKAKQKLTK